MNAVRKPDRRYPKVQVQQQLDDWCHLCGRRAAPNVEVWYRPNAEHPHVGGADIYFRICRLCVVEMLTVVDGEATS